ncbi:efflux transporter outer membrane subunit [Campylobacter gastrosuis]|uniref:TolC family protein n=1 Tax=Campylobacter gastrosuis TaxID=2974576 RepID=A0ABT7HRK1_9BACT|nr:TolC family protein [Campylobacter gastrosuis]MDL0089541.1 TolC family protein [Campylobacter gastrosuis]
MRNFIVFLLALFVAGCSFRPEIPSVDTSFEYKYETTQISDKWWQSFGDERLNSLVEEALKNNIDLKVAYINLQQAELSLKNSKADLLPNLGLNGQATRSANGVDTNSKAGFSLNTALNYEIDLWGRVRNTIASNNALLKASEYDYNASKLSIASNTANSYLSLVALKMQEAVYIDSLKSYEDTMNYRKKQLEVGSITQDVYLQSVASVQSAKIGLNEVRTSITQTATALAILAGKSNDEILKAVIKTTENLPNAPQIDADISSDVLLKRSDVASAYENLKSKNALVGVAKAAYFPTLSLTGMFGYSSNELDRLFIPSASAWSLGGSLAQTIFDYGKTSNNVKLAKLSQDISLLTYEKAVKTALSDVKVALDTRKNADEILTHQNELLSSQSQIYDLINAQYNAGYIDHLNLLDAQRNLLNAKISQINAKLNANQAAVGVFRAFGGGFKVN